MQLQARGLVSEIKEEGKETLVVLGAGWAGYQFMQKLDKVITAQRNVLRNQTLTVSISFRANTRWSRSVAALLL